MKTPTSEPMTTEVKIGLRSLAYAALILLSLMTITGGLTRIIPPESYERVLTREAETVPPGSFAYGGPVSTASWRWYTAPIEVLQGPDAVTVISSIVFVCLIAGSINILNSGGIISSIARRFSEQRYRIKTMIILIFMLFGSILWSMDEVVVLVLLFSGAPYRILIGIAIYLVYTAFAFYHSIRTASQTLQKVIPADSAVQQEDPLMSRAVIWFTSWVSLVVIISSGPYQAVILLCLLVLILNSFISSGSANAFRFMPIIPLWQILWDCHGRLPFWHSSSVPVSPLSCTRPIHCTVSVSRSPACAIEHGSDGYGS